jgi:hypothetical protein
MNTALKNPLAPPKVGVTKRVAEVKGKYRPLHAVLDVPDSVVDVREWLDTEFGNFTLIDVREVE